MAEVKKASDSQFWKDVTDLRNDLGITLIGN